MAPARDVSPTTSQPQPRWPGGSGSGCGGTCGGGCCGGGCGGTSSGGGCGGTSSGGGCGGTGSGCVEGCGGGWGGGPWGGGGWGGGGGCGATSSGSSRIGGCGSIARSCGGRGLPTGAPCASASRDHATVTSAPANNARRRTSARAFGRGDNLRFTIPPPYQPASWSGVCLRRMYRRVQVMQPRTRCGDAHFSKPVLPLELLSQHRASSLASLRDLKWF